MTKALLIKVIKEYDPKTNKYRTIKFYIVG